MDTEFKKTKTSNKDNLSVTESSRAVNLMHLPLDVLERIYNFTSLNDVVALSSVCVDLQWKMQALTKQLDFRYSYSLDVKCLLNHALSTSCTSINVNYCYWLKPRDILEMISKTKLEHLHVIECQLDEECVRAIGELELLSLSFSCNALKSYLELHSSDALRCLQTIRSLEIFYRPHAFNSVFFYELTKTVFQQCAELEHLTISHSKLPYSDILVRNRVWKSELSTRSARPLPKLKSLVFSNVNKYNEAVYNDFIKLMFPNKIIWFEHFDFGYCNDHVFKNEFISYPQILTNRSTFCFWYDEEYPYNADEWLKNEQVEKVLSRPNYEKLILKGFREEGFLEMVQKLVSSSAQTIKEINMDFCRDVHVMDSLIYLAVNCPQITSVDISEWNAVGCFVCENDERKLDQLLEALSRLKNLKKLFVNVYMLIEVHTNTSESAPLPAFWKVTTACKQLTEICILEQNRDSYGILSTLEFQVLYDIAHCESLKSLHLDFDISDGKFDLSRITQNCIKLEHLFFHVLVDFDDKSLEDCLRYAKNIKTLSLTLGSEGIVVSKTFVDSLCSCQHLERIYLKEVSIQDEDVPYFSSSLLKLKNLVAVIIDGYMETSVVDHLKRKLDSFASQKPAFFYSLQECNEHSNVPEAHLDLILN